MNLKSLSPVYSFFVKGKEKAVAAAIVGFVVSFVAQHFGYHTGDALQQTIISLLVGVLAHVGVYFTPNTKKDK